MLLRAMRISTPHQMNPNQPDAKERELFLVPVGERLPQDWSTTLRKEVVMEEILKRIDGEKSVCFELVNPSLSTSVTAFIAHMSNIGNWTGSKFFISTTAHQLIPFLASSFYRHGPGIVAVLNCLPRPDYVSSLIAMGATAIQVRHEDVSTDLESGCTLLSAVRKPGCAIWVDDVRNEVEEGRARDYGASVCIRT